MTYTLEIGPLLFQLGEIAAGVAVAWCFLQFTLSLIGRAAVKASVRAMEQRR